MSFWNMNLRKIITQAHACRWLYKLTLQEIRLEGNIKRVKNDTLNSRFTFYVYMYLFVSIDLNSEILPTDCSWLKPYLSLRLQIIDEIASQFEAMEGIASYSLISHSRGVFLHMKDQYCFRHQLGGVRQRTNNDLVAIQIIILRGFSIWYFMFIHVIRYFVCDICGLRCPLF